MSHLYTVQELRAIEAPALAELPQGTLMQRAGEEAAALALHLLSPGHENARVLILAGPGNNGGDALEMAIVLARHKLNVSVLLIDTPRTEDARRAKERASNSAIRWEDSQNMGKTLKVLADTPWDLIVDGLFGIGLTKPLEGDYYRLAEMVNTCRCPVIALDVPSGLDADTGNIHGIAIRATDTITFIGKKPGFYTGKGRDYAGNIHPVSLGIETRHLTLPARWLSQPSLFSAMLKKRLHDSHKGSYGRIAILGGEKGMAGAPVLAAKAALYCGTGLTYTVYLNEPPELDPVQPELMYRAASRFDFSSLVTVIGPGLGTSKPAQDLVEAILNLEQPLVIDADALNIISANTDLQQILQERHTPTLLTPHPLEAARLLQSTTENIQADRLQAAHTLAKRFHATVILKGSGTIIAHPDGRIAVNPTGNPALATPGSGDILSGICGALLTQKWPAWEAALAAVWIHGAAADSLVKRGDGPVGLTAGELIPEVRKILNRLIQEYGQ